MKVFTRTILFALIIFFCGTFSDTEAARVQLYDGNVNDIMNGIRETENKFKRYREDAEFREYFIKSMREKGLSDADIKKAMSIDLKLRGEHYFTGTDGFRYLEYHFGDSDKNRLVFNINNDGSVSSAWIIFPIYTLAGKLNEEDTKSLGVFIGSIIKMSGMSDDESNNIMNQAETWFNNFKTGQQPDKTFSVWCFGLSN